MATQKTTPTAPASGASSPPPPLVRKRGGRPANPEKRDKHSTVYWSPLEYLTVKRRADKAGLNLSDYCRQMVLKGQAKVALTPAENAVLNEAARLGNNLNQIAHKAHADGIRSIALEAGRLLTLLGEILDKPAAR